MRYIFLAIIILLSSACTYSKSTIKEFGFKNYEIYKTKDDAHSLNTVDIDNDGKKDIILVDNLAAQISIYYQLKDKELKNEKKNFYKNLSEENINTLSFDFRYKNIPFVTEKNVTSLAIENVGGDKRKDLIYLTSTGELNIYYQTKKRVFSDKQTFTISDFFSSPYALVAGDINSDNLSDVIVLGKKYLYIFYQNSSKKLSLPIKYPYTAKSPLGIEIVDINGDKRDDILFVTSGGVNYLKIKLQNKNGELGPEYAIKYPNFHYLTSKNILKKYKGSEIISSRANAHMIFIDKIEKNDKKSISPALYSLDPDGNTINKPYIFDDFNKDGKVDLIISDPTLSSYQFFEGDNKLFKNYIEYPTLKGVTKLLNYPISSKINYLLMFSKDEHSLAIKNFNTKLNDFPKILSFDGDVEGVDVIKGTLFVLLKKDNKFNILKGKIDNKGKFSVIKKYPIKKLSGDVVDIKVGDFNYNNKTDLMIFKTYEPTTFYFQKNDTYLPISIDIKAIESMLQSTSPSSVLFKDFNKDGKNELIFSMKKMIRVISFKEGKFQILYQINGAQNSNFSNIAFSNLYGKNQIYSFDRSNNQLSIFNMKTFKKENNIEVPFLNVGNITSIDLDKDGVKEIILFSKNSIAIFSSKDRGYILKNLLKYTLPHPKSISSVIQFGNFGGKKIISIDGMRHFIEFFDYSSKGLNFVLRFKVFETKSYRNDQNITLEEPKDIKIEDMDGDNKDDIVVRVHNKILVYYQQ